MIRYEWDLETVDRETGDILDHHHAAYLNQLPEAVGTETTFQRIVLVRDVGDEVAGLKYRLWACVENGKLPKHFHDDCEEETEVRVPLTYHRELSRRTQKGTTT